ncbi:MAG: hypothetical protein JXQ82_08150 [Methanomicrobiaceae archaeon]|nr:hypothetical protein [Methanomicrobiaceae archaeon]
MRILAIGVGGAGSRIVDQLYYQDRRSSVSCISSVVVDIDGNLLSQLRNLPEETKLFFPALDPEVHFDVNSTVDVSEIMSKIKKMDNVNLDAIMVFVGLGGNMSNIIPELTEEIRKSYFEPVFAVCTLPYLREGRSIAKKAADDLDIIEDCVDAVILFDNETWYRKIKDSFETTLDERGIPVVKPSPFGRAFPENPRDLYNMLNDRISRQVGLLLRAGEFNESGFDSAEIVLDAGEILNTLKGNGMTAIGYAIEILPPNWLETLDKWRSDTYFTEGSHKRATRIVALAKQAVYEDISIPCDLTSADKALVLIAGPSKELSMKGFQTVRKWIDSSIAGLEMRSGDYPVRNTRYVGIIIMLSGIHNIPRLEEIRKLREEYLLEEKEREMNEENNRILEEEEALLLSGRTGIMNRNDDNTQFSDLTSPYENVSEQTPQINSNRAETGYTSISDTNTPSYDEQTLEDEAWGLIGGYSSAPPRTYRENSNLPPIIEDNGFLQGGSYPDKNQNGDTYYNSRYDDQTGHVENLDIADFLEEDDMTQNENSLSFVELLDDDDSSDYEDNSEENNKYGVAKTARFLDEAFTYIPEEDSKTDNIPLTSPEFVKRQEYEEYKEEESERAPVKKRENIQDDKIVIAGKKEKAKDNNGINLPGRSQKTNLDMTRMTSVDLGHAPKDSMFGVKDIKGPGIPKERSDVARVGEKISIGGSVQHASDRAFSAGTFSAGSGLRPNDNTFSGRKISGGSFIKPNDNAFSGSRVSIKSNIKANDNSISGGKVSIRPNIRPKDNLTGGRVSMGGSAKKPVELLSGGIKAKTGKKPKELLSGGIRADKGVKTKELLSGDLKIGGNPVKPKESLSGELKVGKNPGATGPEKRTQVSQNINKKKSGEKSSFSSDKDDDLFWI